MQRLLTNLPREEDWSLVDGNANRNNDDELEDKTEQKRDYADKDDRYKYGFSHLQTQKQTS